MKKNKVLIIAIVLILILIVATIIIKIMPKTNTQSEVKVIDKIEDYGYILEDNKTAIHKEYFKDLIDILKADAVDEEAYAKTVAKLFISDFYNLDNKITKNDIGGMQFVYTPAQPNVILKAKDTMYKYIESNIDGNRKQKLPIVSEVKIKDIKTTEFEYNKETDDKAIEVSVEWTYKEDLEYQDSATITLIHENNKLSIAELE